MIDLLADCFRPLSRGLSFNMEEKKTNVVMNIGFSSPFSGTFFQLLMNYMQHRSLWVFVPFLGDFLSIAMGQIVPLEQVEVFVPFLGDFLSISGKPQAF